MVALAAEREWDRRPRYGDPEVDSLANALSGDAAARADSLAVIMAVVPAVLRAATVFANDEHDSSAESYARLIVETCRRQAEDGPGRAYWDSVAEPIKLAFLERRQHAEILRWRDARINLQTEPDTITFITLAANATPEEAIAVHVPIMPILEKLYKPGDPVHRLILLPYVEKYWAEKFARMRVRFPRPILVESLLPEALQAPEHVRVRSILRTILSGLRARPPEELASWLSG
jgi:hypothetical protein